MNSFFFLVLCAMAAFAVTDARMKRAAVPLTFRATPRVSVQGLTEEIKLECRPPANLNLMFAFLLHVERTDENGTVSVVASKTPTTLTLPDENNRTSAEGYIQKSASDNQKSSLVIRIQQPTVSDGGQYECKFVYIDNKITAHTLGAIVNVTVSEIPPPNYSPVSGDCECDALWDEIDQIKASLAAGGSQGGAAQPVDGSCQASFSARFETRQGYAIIDGTTAMFDYVITNKGGAYDGESGVFTAPCAGQYFFTLTLRSEQSMDSGNVEGVITVDDVPQAKTAVFVDAPIDNIQSASNALVLGLKKDQKVKVVVRTTSSGEFIGEESSIFSGFYISP